MGNQSVEIVEVLESWSAKDNHGQMANVHLVQHTLVPPYGGPDQFQMVREVLPCLLPNGYRLQFHPIPGDPTWVSVER